MKKDFAMVSRPDNPPQAESSAPLHPLTEFYRHEGGLPLAAEPVDGEQIPQPYRRLLVHRSDMTPTLEAFCGRPIHLRLLERRIEGDAMLRLVLLLAKGDESPMEFGAIRIYLDLFKEEPRNLILQGERPLGTILHQFRIGHHSRPSGYYRFTPDERLRAAFGLRGSPRLFGRHNVICDDHNQRLAEVVEILPPLDEPQSKEHSGHG